MFLQPDDYLVVQDAYPSATWWNDKARRLRVDELKRMHDECGINTIFTACYWSEVEQDGWTLVDEQIKVARAGGMKVLMATPISPPQNLDDGLYGMGRDGAPYRGLLSYWNQGARDLTAKFIQDLLSRHAASDVNFIYGGLITEHYLWNAPVYLDRAARTAFQQEYDGDLVHHARGISTVTKELRQFLQDSVIDYNLFAQSLLVEQHQEIWDHTQYVIGLQSEHNAVFARPYVYEAYQQHFPEATRMMMASTYWNHGVGNAQRVNDILSMYDARILVEASYCEGLRDGGTADLALAGGLCKDSACPSRWQGQAVAPFNSFGDTDNYGEISEWKYHTMRETVDKWGAVRCS